MATLQGIYSASVVDTRDPDGLARVLVRLSGLPDTAGTTDVWARVATLMAGRNRGIYCLPEAGDEVLVAFERGDIKLPYVVGALWNAKARPPVEPPTAVKLIRSRSGMTIRFRDDNNSLVIETAGGQRITLQDGPGSVRAEDANGNLVMLGTSGVTVEASTSVTIRAGARVLLNASTVEVNSTTATVNTQMVHFSGVVQCDTLIANSVISASYSPGAGNVM